MGLSKKTFVYLFFTLLVFVFSTSAKAQSGSITGKTFDIKTDKGIPAKHLIWQFEKSDSTLIADANNDSTGAYTIPINLIPTSVKGIYSKVPVKFSLTGGTNFEGNKGNFRFLKSNDSPVLFQAFDVLGREYMDFKKEITGPAGEYNVFLEGKLGTGSDPRAIVRVTGNGVNIAQKLFGYKGFGTASVTANIINSGKINSSENIIYKTSGSLEDVVLRMRTSADGYEDKDTVFSVPRDNPSKYVAVAMKEKTVDVKLLLNDLDIIFRPHNGNPLKLKIDDEEYTFKKNSQGVIDTVLKVPEKYLDKTAKLYFLDKWNFEFGEDFLEALLVRRRNAKMGEKNIFQSTDESDDTQAYAMVTLRGLSENDELDVLRVPAHGLNSSGQFAYYKTDNFTRLLNSENGILNKNIQPVFENGKEIDSIYIFINKTRVDNPNLGLTITDDNLNLVVDDMALVKNFYESVSGGRTLFNVSVNVMDNEADQKYQYVKNTFNGQNLFYLKFSKYSQDWFEKTIVSSENRIVGGDFCFPISITEPKSFSTEVQKSLIDFKLASFYSLNSNDVYEFMKIAMYYRQLKDANSKYP